MKTTQPSEQRPFANLQQPPGLAGLSQAAGPHYLNVELRTIVGASPLQVRAPFNPEADEQDQALLASLESDGQRLPVLLVENPDTTPPTYTPLDGHRRIEALRRLKRDRVQAIVHSAGSLDCDVITLTANVRKHLTPLEQARAVVRLRDRHSLKMEDIARRVGLSVRYLSELRALLDTDPSIQAALEQGQLRAKTALALGQAPLEVQPQLVKIAEGQTVTEADAKRWVERMIGNGESPEQAARAVGLIATPPVADAPAPTAAGAAPAPAQPPAKVRVRREAALNVETATALLGSTFLQVEPALITGLAAAAVEHKASAAQLKLAALLALAGSEPAKAVEDAGYAARHPSVRKLVPIVDVLADLRSLVKARRYTRETADMCAALSRQFGELKQAMSGPKRPASRKAKEVGDGTLESAA